MTLRGRGGWFILGNYGARNTGDEAMLAGLVYGLRTRAQEVPIAAVSRTGSFPLYLEEMGVCPVEARVRPVWQAVRSARGVILGGGTHFHDDYVITRYVRHLRYMMRYLLLLKVARLLQKRVFLLGMGFGPFRFKLTELITREICALADHIAVRDPASFQRIRKWVGSSKLTQAFDLAALLCSWAETRESVREGGSSWRGSSISSHHGAAETRGSVKESGSAAFCLGVSVISIANIPGYGPRSDAIFQAAVREAIQSALREVPNLKASIFVFRGAWPREEDVKVSAQLYTALSKVSSNVVLVPYSDDPRRLLEWTARCDFFVATRFHSAIFAYLTQRPFLCLAYHHKCSDLALAIGLPPYACLRIDEVLRGELESRLLDLLRQPAAFRASLPVAQAESLAWQNLEVLPHL